MAGWRDVPLEDTPTGPVVVGSPPVWTDDSDTTYVEVVAQYFGPGNPVFGETASVELAPGELARVTGVRIRARIAAVEGTNVGYPGGRLQLLGSDNEWFVYPEGLAPATPTWVTYDLTPEMSPEDMQLLTGEIQADAWRVSILPASYPTSAPSELQRWEIYEVRLEAKALSVAPPCRLFPRDDDLGVGGARIYPPPKSQQRSGRRFGYY